jgi:ankyrin repeat protein
VDNVNGADTYGWTALHCAAAKGYLDCVKYCIEIGANVNACDRYDYTPLHRASFCGHFHVAHELLNAGANVDATDNHGLTLLHWAIFKKRIDFLRLFIDRGAKVSNVKLDGVWLTAIPDWVTTLIESRSRYRTASVVVIGIHKYCRTTVPGDNDINVLKLISKHIWSTRMDEAVGWHEMERTETHH